MEELGLLHNDLKVRSTKCLLHRTRVMSFHVFRVRGRGRVRACAVLLLIWLTPAEVSTVGIELLRHTSKYNGWRGQQSSFTTTQGGRLRRYAPDVLSRRALYRLVYDVGPCHGEDEDTLDMVGGPCQRKFRLLLSSRLSQILHRALYHCFLRVSTRHNATGLLSPSSPVLLQG